MNPLAIRGGGGGGGGRGGRRRRRRRSLFLQVSLYSVIQ
jgi:hypothetical protein